MSEVKQRFACRVPFYYGMGDTKLEAVENCIKAMGGFPESKQVSVEVFSGTNLTIDGMGTISGTQMQQLPDEKAKEVWKEILGTIVNDFFEIGSRIENLTGKKIFRDFDEYEITDALFN